MASDAGADRPERLGWLTESAVQPRKRKMIEGELPLPSSTVIRLTDIHSSIHSSIC